MSQTDTTPVIEMMTRLNSVYSHVAQMPKVPVEEVNILKHSLMELELIMISLRKNMERIKIKGTRERLLQATEKE
jgi:hypothetical protein